MENKHKEYTKIQEKILSELWWAGKKEDIPTIAQNTNLTKQKVYDGVRELKNRILIKKSIKKNKLNKERLYVEFNDAIIPRIKRILGLE